MDHEKETRSVVDAAVSLGLLDLSVLDEESIELLYQAAGSIAACLNRDENIIAPLFTNYGDCISCICLTNERILETVPTAPEEWNLGVYFIVDGAPLRNITSMKLDIESNQVSINVEADESAVMSGGYALRAEGIGDRFAENFKRLYEESMSTAWIPAFPKLQDVERPSSPYGVSRHWRPILSMHITEAVEEPEFISGAPCALLIGTKEGAVKNELWEQISNRFPYIPEQLSGLSMELGELAVVPATEDRPTAFCLCCAAEEVDGLLTPNLKALETCMKRLRVYDKEHCRLRYHYFVPWGTGCEQDIRKWPRVRSTIEEGLTFCFEGCRSAYICKPNSNDSIQDLSTTIYN